MTAPLELSFGKYRVTRLVGRGGMAEVYEGVHPDLGRRVAIKVVLPQLAETQGFEERFRREARLVASLRHPHIVQLYDFDVVDGRAYMVMEYLDGGTLGDRLQAMKQRGDLLPLAETARILDAIAGALDYAHGQGVVHRDIKPGNVLFTVDDQPVLSDFGIAYLEEGAVRLTATGGIVGSPAYMAPEQATGQPLDARTDLYALGVVLYEMATGRVPFEGKTPTVVLLKQVQEPPPPPTDLNPNLPKSVAAVILRALAKNPDDRFPTAGALAQAFGAALAAEASEVGGPHRAGAEKAPDEVGAAPGPAAGPPLASAQEEQPGWLTRVINAAGVVAPLVGADPKGERPSRQDRRARLAALLGAIAIFVSLINFVNGVFDLVNVSEWPLARAWPFVIAALFIAGVGLSIYTIRTASTRRRRWQAAVLLGAVVLAALTWGGWTAYQRFKPAAGFLVTVNQFDGSQASAKLDIARSISDGLRSELRDVHEAIAVERTNAPVEDEMQARKLGESRKSTLVIWGWYDDQRFRSSVELIKVPDLRQQGLTLHLTNSVAAALAPDTAPRSPAQVTPANLSRYTSIPANMQRLDFELDHASRQMAYVSEAILGVGMYSNEAYDEALALFDKALANADEQGASFLGEEKVYFHRAMALFALGRVDEAVPDLEKAIELKPDLYEAHHNLALAYAQTCNPSLRLDRAIAEAETAVRLRPDEAEAHRLQADLYHRAGREADAEAALKAAITRNPGDALSYQLLGDVYASQGNSAASQEAYAQALALTPESGAGVDPVSSALQRGDVLVGAGRYTEAITAYESAGAAAPDRSEPLRGLGNAYYWQGDTDKAIAAYQTWEEMAPMDAAAPLLLGLALANTGQTDRAIAALETASKLAKCDPAPGLVLAGLYWQQEDYDRATQAYEAALAIDPANADAQYVLGSTYFLQDKPDKALSPLQQAVRLRPDFVEANRSLGQIYFQKQRWAEAAQAYERLAALAPGDANALAFLGDAYSLLGRRQDAAGAYQRSLQVEDNAATRALLGMVKVQLGDLTGAEADYRQALALEPGSAATQEAMGNLLLQLGRPEEAVTAFRKAIALGETALRYVRLATALGRLGRMSEAITAVESAIALDPSDASARFQLGELYARQGDLPQAQQAYQAAIDRDDHNAQAQFALAVVAYKQCSPSSALQAQSRATALAAGASVYRAFQAGLLEALGRSEEALAIYQALADAPAADMFAHNAAGNRFFWQGQYDEAARQFERILAQDAPPDFAAFLAHNGLGRVNLAQGKFLPARSEFEQALAAFPAGGADPQMALGDVALREGDVAAALAAYDRVTDLLPAYQAIYAVDEATLLEVGLQVRRALALDRSGDAEAAQAARKQALSLAQGVVDKVPRSPLGHLALGLAYRAAGETDLADAAFATAAQCDQTLKGISTVLEDYLRALAP